MTFEQRERLGVYYGRTFFLQIRADPDLNTVEDFAVILYFEDETGDSVEVLRVDQTHGYTHIDRLYRRDEPKDTVDWDLFEAWEQISENWRTYARSYADKENLDPL